MNQPTAIIIGLDGVPFSLITKYAANGLLPNIASAIRRGTIVRMESSIPDVSSTAWSSVITGKNPGEHGIYGFIEVDPATYGFRFPQYNDLKADPFWKGKRSAIINVPQTFPAKIDDGFMVSGFVALDMARSVTPASWLPELNRLGYMLDVDSDLAQRSIKDFMDNVYRSLEARDRLLPLAWNRGPWDIFYFVFTETDRVNHFLFEAWEDELHPHHRAFVDFYTKVDEYVGNVMAAVGKEARVYLHSDHGFCPLKHEVYINHWLKTEGFLRFTTDAPRMLTDMDPASVAFALDPARIYINSTDRFTKGTVPPEKKREVKAQIVERLKDLLVEGVSPVERVLDGNEIFHGPHAHRAPDLVLMGRRGYDLKATLSSTEIYGRRHFTGMHTQDDAFLIHAQPEPRALPNPFHVEKIAGLLFPPASG